MSSTTTPVTLQTVLEDPATRPARASALSASRTFFWRGLLKVKHVPELLFDVTLMPLIGTLMFTYLFGGALAGSTDAYIQFLLPGILVQTIVMTTMYTGFGLNTDITKGVFDRFRTLPIWRPSALVGSLVSDVIRYTVAGVLTISLGLILGFRPDAGATGVLAALGLLFVFCYALAWVWTFVALLLPSPQTVTSVSLAVTFPLTFVSNIFVDPATMPSWLENVVDVNPISVLVTAIRGLMDGSATTGQIGAVLLISAGIMVVFGPLTMWRYNAER